MPSASFPFLYKFLSCYCCCNQLAVKDRKIPLKLLLSPACALVLQLDPFKIALWLSRYHPLMRQEKNSFSFYPSLSVRQHTPHWSKLGHILINPSHWQRCEWLDWLKLVKSHTWGWGSSSFSESTWESKKIPLLLKKKKGRIIFG